MDSLDFDTLDQYLLEQGARIIHQIWFGLLPTKRQAKKDFEKLRKYRDTWLLHNPDWCYVCWNYDRCRELVRKFYPQHYQLYQSYPYHIQRCDAVRYMILHRYGGLYADMDYVCNKPWNEVCAAYPGDIYLVETPNKVSSDVHISNSLMYARKREHPFWTRVFIDLEMHATMPSYYGKHLTVMYTAGPAMLNRAFHAHRLKDYLDFYPAVYFQPYGVTSGIGSLNRPDVYAIHVSKGAWSSLDSVILNFLYQEWRILLFVVGVFLIAFALQTLKDKLNTHFA